MEIITSKDNQKIKAARKLLHKKYRKSSYLIEGFHLLEEAVKFDRTILQVFVEENKLDKLPATLSNLTVVTAEVLKSLSDTATPQGVIAEVAKPDDFDFAMTKVLVLENVQNPGNVGTMIRTADAADFDAVFTSADTADIYSPKVMRAMQGSNFHLPIIDGVALPELFEQLRRAQLKILVSTLAANSLSHKAVKFDRFALVMGNEGQGVSDFAAAQADQLIHIEMPGQAESLNVAVAAGILMFSL